MLFIYSVQVCFILKILQLLTDCTNSNSRIFLVRVISHSMYCGGHSGDLEGVGLGLVERGTRVSQLETRINNQDNR